MPLWAAKLMVLGVILLEFLDLSFSFWGYFLAKQAIKIFSNQQLLEDWTPQNHQFRGNTSRKRMLSGREFSGGPWKLSIPKTKLNLKSIFLNISGSYSICSQTSQWQQSLASIKGCNCSKSSYNSYPYFIEISSSCMQIINVKCKWFGSLRCNRTLVGKYKQQRSKSSFDLWNVKNVNLREKRKKRQRKNKFRYWWILLSKIW